MDPMNSADPVVERARGVLAERFGVEIAAAKAILDHVARLQDRAVTELAAAVVASCTEQSPSLPRRLYVDGDGLGDMA